MNTAQTRTQEHLNIRQLMSSGNYAEALSKIKSTKSNLGDHIFLQIDLAACYYMLKDYYLFRSQALNAYENLKKFSDILNDKSYILSCIGIGRFMEELGLLDAAMNLYQGSLFRIEMQDLEISSQIHAQRLRLKAFMGVDKSIYEDYSICEKAAHKIIQAGFPEKSTDLWHALIMADHYIGSSDLGTLKIEKILSFIKNPYEKNLIVIDHLSETLSKKNISELTVFENQLLKNVDYIKADAFEKGVIHLIENQQIELDSINDMSLQGAFKFLYLLQKNIKYTNHSIEGVDAKYFLTLQRFEESNHKILLRRWPLENNSKIEISNFNDDIIVSINHRKASIKNKSLQGQILRLIQNKEINEKLDIEIVLREIYEESLSSHSYEKLRQAVFRLNQDLAKKIGIKNTLKITSQYIQRLH